MQILVLGAVSWNRMIYTDPLPDGQSATVFGATSRETAGSTGMGKALAARAFRQNVTLQAVLGADDRAERIHAIAAAKGVDLLADIDADHPTPHHLNIMDGKGGRISFLLENGGPEPVIDRERLASRIAKADVIFASLSNSTRCILDMLDGASSPIHVDLHDWDGQNEWHRPFIQRADIIQLSAEALATPEVTARGLLGDRCKEVVLTKGAAGAELFTHDGGIYVPPCPATIADSNGAGDAFAVIYTLSRLRGESLQTAGRLAAAAGALTVECADLIPGDLSENRLNARSCVI